MKRRLGVTLLALLAITGLASWWCAAPRYADVGMIRSGNRQPGTVLSVTRVGGHSRPVLQALLWWADLPVKVPVSDGIEMFRVDYWSQLDGRPVEASGLLAVPYTVLRGGPSRGTVVYLHGTSPDRANSPSAPAVEEGLLPAAVFAGGGYTLLAPDYIGLGQSRAPQTYLDADATAAAARDLIVAARHVGDAMKLAQSADLFCVGFSQGGHATAVVQRALETTPVTGVHVKAAAAISGAFDLAGISLPYAIRNRHPLYLAYLADSYALQYHQALGTLLVPKYAAVVPRLFDGNHSVDAISAGLPRDPHDLFLPARLAEFSVGKPNWFTAALVANQAWNWAPKAPLRLYYGDRDQDVSPDDSKHFAATATRLGGNVQLVPLGPYDHGQSALHAVPLARQWFDQLSSPQRAF
jgi:pimeloyl-ACP methyl ester carboxylesterase